MARPMRTDLQERETRVSDPQGVIRVQQLTKHFGSGDGTVEALRGVDLEVTRGEFLAVMGPSGSGKSTLLHLIGGLDEPTSGHVEVEGKNLRQLNDDRLTQLRRKQFGFVFQAFNLLEVLTARENVALPLEIDGAAEHEAVQRADDSLRLVEMQDRGHHLPSQLSGGQQQRLTIARALVTKPLVLLADEPTGNLDSATGDQIMRLLRRLADQDGQTILMVTHEPRYAAMADRVVKLRDGRIVKVYRCSDGASYHEVLKDLEPQP